MQQALLPPAPSVSARSVHFVLLPMGRPCLRRSDIHVHDPDAHAESGLTNADRRLLIGALEYKDKRCAAPVLAPRPHALPLLPRSGCGACGPAKC
jgi:hypothetical protein